MPHRRIVVVGASSGGMEALGEVVKGLPRDLPAAVFVVQHVAADSPNYLLQHEVDIIRDQTGDIDTAVRLGELVPSSCPDCGGPLWEMDEPFQRYRCHTGHGFTARHLVEGLQEAEEQSLWVALRLMEERARMLRRMAKKDAARGHKLAHVHSADKAEEAEEHVRRLRGLLKS